MESLSKRSGAFGNSKCSFVVARLEEFVTARIVTDSWYFSLSIQAKIWDKIQPESAPPGRILAELEQSASRFVFSAGTKGS